MMKFWHKYQYKNLTLIGISFVIAFYLLKNEQFIYLLHHLGNWDYLGAFIGGILFVCSFTISIGAVVLYLLSTSDIPTWEIAYFATLGQLTFDFAVLQLIRNTSLDEELKSLFDSLGGYKIRHLFKTKYFGWTLPVIGAFILASPLPDELGISLMGISKIKMWRFLLIAFLLDFIGVYAVILAARAL